MLLKNLISNLTEEKKKIKIRGLASDSKKIKMGYIFFAIKGSRFNGEKYIDAAIKNGAKVVVCSKSCKYKNNNILILKKSNVRYFLSEIASKFYKLKPKNIIAVTGTNGKTSVADLFYQILNINNIPVASIGTLGIKFKGRKIKSDLTSPDTISLHQNLEKLKKLKIDNVIIEASSHGLHQKRLHHLSLNAAIFTNFSQDHLDYHKTMQSYLNAKLILFNEIISNRKSIICDNSIKEFSILKKISRKRNLRLIDIDSIKNSIEKNHNLILNKFQLINLAMAIAAAKLSRLKDKTIYNSLNKIKDVDGRFELVRKFPNNIKVYVDFAHTPDALKKSIEELNNLYPQGISIVFGCGGDRDYKKRPKMGKIVSSKCNKIYVTDDNPRNENPEKIRRVIIKNIRNKNCFNIGSRSKAIKTAIQHAEPNEVILVAGKGHEGTQIYKNKTLKTSDKQIIKKTKIKIQKISSQTLNFIENKKIIKQIIKNLNVNDFHGISIDSRNIIKDNLFLTIKGKNNDGIKFIPQAIKKGAKYIVTRKKNIQSYKNKIIKVHDEIKFLNNFASKKRKMSKSKICAVTGSAGKTSLKNLLRNLLQNYGETFSSPKSFNNHLGVPLSLSQLKTNHKYAIFEVGMSKIGEINSLSKLIKPHIGIITNIGEAHIENFKNINGIARAKGEIINNIKKKGYLIINRDDKFFNYLKKKGENKKLNIISFGMSKKSDVFPLTLSKNKKKHIYKIKVMNKILTIENRNLNIYNILATLTVLKILDLDLHKIENFFKYYEPTEGRGKIHKIKRYKKLFKLIDESYNANPLSVKNAIQNFNSIKKDGFKKYLLLGDMLELGNKSENLHRNLAKNINNSDIDKVFVKGNKTLDTFRCLLKNKRGNIFQQEEDVDLTFNNIIANNDYLMIKGSNATGLNKLTKRMIRGN